MKLNLKTGLVLLASIAALVAGAVSGVIEHHVTASVIVVGGLKVALALFKPLLDKDTVDL